MVFQQYDHQYPSTSQLSLSFFLYTSLGHVINLKYILYLHRLYKESKEPTFLS